MTKYYTGIGARKTPAFVLKIMEEIAVILAKKTWILRSGGAEGADSAFERGCNYYLPGEKEIYLPWKRFNGNNSNLYNISGYAYKMAESLHPAWDKCSSAVRKLHSRNMHQVLGPDLKTPSNALICWTPNGKDSGGTGQAIRLAEKHNIFVLNLYNHSYERIIEIVSK